LLDHFYTIQKESTGLYKEKGSKFIAFAYPVNSIKSINEKLELLRKQYHDARHYCYAYILGNDGKIVRANDDGEPNHSAGDPILGQIKSLNLTNTLVVVIRYFGGTKLGVSGLINAYKTSAEEALKTTNSIKVFITTPITVTYSYSSTNEVMRLVNDFELSIIDQEFAEDCILKAEVIISKHPLLLKELQLLSDTGHQVVFNNSLK